MTGTNRSFILFISSTTIFKLYNVPSCLRWAKERLKLMMKCQQSRLEKKTNWLVVTVQGTISNAGHEMFFDFVWKKNIDLHRICQSFPSNWEKKVSLETALTTTITELRDCRGETFSIFALQRWLFNSFCLNYGDFFSCVFKIIMWKMRVRRIRKKAWREFKVKRMKLHFWG